MNTEAQTHDPYGQPAKRFSRGSWLLPLLLALPFLAALIFAAVRFGPDLRQLLSAAIKTAVVR